MGFHERINDLPLLFNLIERRARAFVFRLVLRFPFRSVGKGIKFFGRSSVFAEGPISVGDCCWLQAVERYKSVIYNPKLRFGSNVSLSDNVHISCVREIYIGSGVLVGSCVYIGDHSHGSSHLDAESILVSPALRSLSDIESIYIGDNVWICDGARILAGAYIPSGSIVGANSVVKGKFDRPGLIVGSPAVLKRVF